MERERDNREGRGLFYGVIGVATLIIAIIGATFAWFTATAGSDADTEIVKTGTLEIEYADGSYISATDMKPATHEQVKTAFANGCKDDKDEKVCASYTFSVTNTGSLKAVISATISLTSNPFTAGALKYALYDESSSFDAATVQTYSTAIAGAPSNVTLASAASKTYTLVFWLDGPTATNNDQNKTLTGTISVTANQTNYVSP